MVLWLSVSSALQSIAYIIPFPKDNDHLCDFQAWFVSFTDWLIALWICIIAFNLYQSVVLQKRNVIMYEKYYHLIAWLLSITIATIPLLISGNEVYGPAGAWCWIVKEHQDWRVVTWYGPLLIFFIYVIVMYLYIIITLSKLNTNQIAFYHREGEDDIRNKWKASLRLSRYPLIFIVLWVIPIINRIQNWIMDDDGIFTLVILHTICVSMQGTINSIVYCFDENILKYCTPTGLIASFNLNTDKQKRQTLELKKYQLQHDEEDSMVFQLENNNNINTVSNSNSNNTNTNNNSDNGIISDNETISILSVKENVTLDE